MENNNVPDIVILGILLGSFGTLFTINSHITRAEYVRTAAPDYHWLVQGLVNVVGYATIIVPGYLAYRYVRRVKYLEHGAGNVCLTGLVRRCFGDSADNGVEQQQPHHFEYQRSAGGAGGTAGAGGNGAGGVSSAGAGATVGGGGSTSLQSALLLFYYFICLLAAFLVWGVLQEKIMTQQYVNELGERGRFRDSQFLVFVNRVLAFCMSGLYILCSRQPRHKCPFYKYGYCSVSNILSSWCQYEALKYLAFPHQVIGKAAKVIPVMVMGKLVSGTKYDLYEYVTAGILSVGMLFFMWDTGNDRGSTTITTFSGVILLCAYIAFDSFTSNWQGALFNHYHMSSVQMMCAVNLCSCAFTAVSLLQQDGFAHSLHFMGQFPAFVFDCLLISVCSAAGQLFIFSTLARFGPLVFTIITTIRQGVSILLSCLIYDHQVHGLGVFGLVLVFFSIFLRFYCSHRLKTLQRKRAQAGSAGATVKV